LTFPVNHGKVLNIVAFRTTSEDWPDYNRLVRPAKREDALKDFEGASANVMGLLKLTRPDLDVVSLTNLDTITS
jgi:salicylate hydroxylase